MKNNCFNKINYRLLVLVIFCFVCSAHNQIRAQDLSSNRFGKGLKVLAKDSSFYLKFGFRFQTLYQGELNLDSEEWADRMLIRRARLKFDGWAYHPSLSYKIELGLSSPDHSGGEINEAGNTARIILDAVAKWQATKNLSIWFGQTKLPGNRERVISSQNLQFVDRSLLNSRLNIDRDIGVQFHHESTIGEEIIVNKIFSVSIGEGRNIITANTGGYDFTYRLEVLPFGNFESGGDYFSSDLKREPRPKLSIGATYDINQNAARQRGQLGSYVKDSNGNQYSSDLKTLFIDAMFKYKGLSFLGEYGAKRGSNQVFATLDDGSTLKYVTGDALSLQTGYLLKNNVEMAFRYTSLTPDNRTYSGMREESQYTLGFSKYFEGHNLKIQSDLSYTDVLNRSNSLMFRLQLEVAF